MVLLYNRSLVSKLRKLEKDTYLVQRALADEPGSEHLLTEMENLEERVCFSTIIYTILLFSYF